MSTEVHDMASLKRLARGVLRQALDDLRYDPSPEEVKETVNMVRGEARAWFLQDTDNGWGSFEHVCKLLQRKPEKIRARLKL